MQQQPCKKGWIRIAFRYLRYRIECAGVKPDSAESRKLAAEVAQLTRFNPLLMGRFLNALLRNHIGKSFPRPAAEVIAVMWCKANKEKFAKQCGNEPKLEESLIISMAERLDVNPAEALAFNDYLKSLD